MFNIIRGDNTTLNNTPIIDGQLLFNTETNKILMDNNSARLQYGGSAEVDSVLSTTSTNPVQNQTITNNTGIKTSLATTDKTNLVSAINEINSNTGKWLGSSTIASGSTTATISNPVITTTSLIDVYYAESSKATVQDATPSYAQTTGVLTITFDRAITDDVIISNVKVVNP